MGGIFFKPTIFHSGPSLIQMALWVNKKKGTSLGTDKVVEKSFLDDKLQNSALFGKTSY